jgi:S1-C subfamily serine protease
VTERAGGAPIAGARVAVEADFEQGETVVAAPIAAVTDGMGAFTLDHVPAGVRALTAAAPGHHPYQAGGLRVEDGVELGPLAVTLGLVAEGQSPALEFEGIGAQLEGGRVALVVRGVLPGSGADAAGLVAGDRILEVDGQSVTDLGLQDAILRLRGPAGSRVALAVRSALDGPVREVDVERRPIRR